MLRLSEAMRLGSMLAPKAIGWRHHPDGGTCALGAIEDALGIGHGEAEQAFPQLLERKVTHPVMGRSVTLNWAVATLNNGCDGTRHFAPWTREEIADWLETFEEAGPDPDPAVESVVENPEPVCA